MESEFRWRKNAVEIRLEHLRQQSWWIQRRIWELTLNSHAGKDERPLLNMLLQLLLGSRGRKWRKPLAHGRVRLGFRGRGLLHSACAIREE